MRLKLACVLALATAVAACDQPKPRDVPPPPPQAALPPGVVAPPPPALEAVAPPPAQAEGLTRRSEPAAFYIDQVGKAANPASQQPAVTDAGSPTLISGFAFDGVAKAPAAGVDVVIDGVAHPATYGLPRKDVADHFKTAALTPVGFNLLLPAGTLAPGVRKVAVRVVAADGASYFESPEVAVTVR